MTKKHLLQTCFHNFLYTTATLIGAALAATLLLYAVYTLPLENIRKNIQTSSFVHLQEGEVYPLSRKAPGSKVDNFTASLMLNTAAFLGRNSTFYDALTNPRTEYGGHSQISNLFLTAQNNSLADAHIINHPRYWHGYLIFLKPLLMFFDIYDIRIINFIFQNILLLFVLYLLYKRINFQYMLAFLLAVIYMNPITLGFSLSYCGIYYIMLIASLFLLTRKSIKQEWKIFLLIGITTSFIDMLTAPLITLAFPLILYISLNKTDFKTAFITATRATLGWSVGYLAMWFLKWLLATLLTDDNIIKDGIDNVICRTTGTGCTETALRNFTPANAIKTNLKELNYDISYIIALIYLLFTALTALYNKHTFIKDSRALLILLIALSPFIWYAIAINHSVIHPLMAYRELSITIFALAAALSLSFTNSPLPKPL